MILTVDIGNSRIKYAVWQTDKIIDRGVVTYAKNNSSESFDQLFSATGPLRSEERRVGKEC